MAKKNKQNMLVWVILAVIVLAALWYYYREPQPTPEEVTPPAKPGVAKGDLIAINFILTSANGSVIGTNNETLAQEYGVKNYVKGPFRFIVGQSGMIKGFDDAMLGMTEVGQKSVRTIPPSEEVLEFVVNRTRSVLRNQPYPRFRELSLEKFESVFRMKPVVGKVVVNASLPWPYIVDEVVNGTVRIEPDLKERKSYRLPGYEWDSELVVKTNLNLIFRHNPAEGQVVTTEFGPAIVTLGDASMNLTYQQQLGDIFAYHVKVQGPVTKPYDFKVTQSDDEQFMIRRINYPEQEVLTLAAELLEWEPSVKDIKAPLLVNGQ